MLSNANGFVINTNMAALIVQRNFQNVTNEMSTLMEHLSTNMKVNRASDDPSGMAISLNYEKQISSMTVAKNNSQTGVSLLQTAENDLKTVQSSLTTMKNLIIQSQTGTITPAARLALDSQFQQLLTEIDRVATTSNYSGIKLMDGSTASLNLQVDINTTANDRIDIAPSLLDSRKASLGLTGLIISTVSGANAAQSIVDTAYDTISNRISKVGAFNTRLNGQIKRLDSKSENLKAANSLIRDTDVAGDTAKLTKAQILQQTSATLLQQANSSAALILTLIGAN